MVVCFQLLDLQFALEEKYMNFFFNFKNTLGMWRLQGLINP
jgi:hypothetical protein